MLSNAEIIETAALTLAVDQSPNDAALVARFKAALDRVEDDGDRICLVMATKLQEGLPYSIQSDRPEIIRRARSVAADLGARVGDLTDDDGSTSVFFLPPVKS